MTFKSLACAAALLLPAGAWAGNTAAVLSAGSGAYLEAFSAFQAAYGSEVPHFDISREKPELPAGIRTVIAFGAKAAGYPYPPGIRLVYCMAPGFFLKAQPQQAKPVKISLVPDFSALLAKIRVIQPGIKKLLVFWMVPDFGRNIIEPLIIEGARQGMQISAVRLESSDDLPSVLRRKMGGMDAFWLPPDPLLITPENLMILREFSWGNAIPFYGSTKGMTREGALASVGVSFSETGAAAAAAVLKLEAGEDLPNMIFPEKTEVTLNASAAKRCRVELPRELIGEAAYLFP